MADVDDYDFSTGDAGASHTFNSEAGQVRVGGFVKLLCYYYSVLCIHLIM